jgi:hypothetical protein
VRFYNSSRSSPVVHARLTGAKRIVHSLQFANAIAHCRDRDDICHTVHNQPRSFERASSESSDDNISLGPFSSPAVLFGFADKDELNYQSGQFSCAAGDWGLSV